MLHVGLMYLVLVTSDIDGFLDRSNHLFKLKKRDGRISASIIKVSFLLPFFLLSFSFFASAQLDVYYLPHNKKINNFRTASHDTIPVGIPFWDDFSTSSTYADTAKWSHSDDVVIQSGMGINPPSINVAVFDGADQYGNAYSSVSTAIGEGDVLTSRFIDLSEAEQSSTHLSFYFQREGHGELPDRQDSLSLFVMGSDSIWQKVWNVSGGDDLNSLEFYFVDIPIDQSKYFFKYFQFKFVSHGRLSGPYDTWNVDYVYLNDGREGKREDLIDHAVVTLPNSIFGKYTLVPYDHFKSDIGLYLEDSISINIINLETQETNIETAVEFRYQETDALFALINSDKELPVNIKAFEIKPTYSNQINPEIFDGIQDSLYLKSVFSLNTLDSINTINLRVNDTVSMNFSIHQELAYDDGTAEYGVGLNSTGSQIAYRFYTPIEDQITGVKMYFPKFGEESSRALTIKVWDALENDESTLSYSQEMIAQTPSTFNEYGYYKFSKPVTVSDTFYIGFQQSTNDFFLVGLDKNTDTGDDIFFNPDVAWQQNTLIRGSLMIRPVFGKAEDIITGLDPELKPEDENSVRFYPNPSDGTFTFSGQKSYFEVYDIFGRLIKSGEMKVSDQLDLSNQKAGIYLVKLRTDGGERTIKLIVY